MKRLPMLAAAVPLFAATISSADPFRAPSFDALPEVKTPAAPDGVIDGVPKGTATGDLALFPQQPYSYPMASKGRRGQASGVYSPPATIEVRPKTEGACVMMADQAASGFRQSQIYTTSGQPPVIVRVENLREDPGGTATYEVSDVVVDSKTLGTKELSKSSVALKKIGVGQDGVVAWGFRTGDTLHVLVANATAGNLVDDDGRFVNMSCGALHVELPVEKDQARSVNGFVMRMVTIEDTRTNDQKVPPHPQQRRMSFAASVSQLSADKTPVLSVTMRWLDELQPNEKVQTPEEAAAQKTGPLIARWAPSVAMDQVAIDEGARSVGEVRFEPASAPAETALVVEVEPPSASMRGRLGEAIEAAIEDALAGRGATHPGVGAGFDADATLSDQLYRARLAGFRRLTIQVGSLVRIARAGGALDPADTDAIFFYVAATRDRPVTIVLDGTTRDLAGYGPPVPFSDLLAARLRPVVAEPPPSVVEPTPEPPSPPTLAVVARVIESAAARPAESARPAETPIAPMVDEPAIVEHEPTTEVRVAPAPKVERALLSPGEYRAFAEELAAARGPKPLAAIERLFLSRYLPLAEAHHAGVLEGFSAQVRAEWAESFARSYIEAFAALRVTGRRPTMVLDAPVLAGKLARLHGARATQLLMVDGMRYDLGSLVHERLRGLLAAHAACAERLLLWSALPSSTPTQLELLARGPEALAEGPPSDLDESIVVRGRAVSTLRRIKVGHRDVVKLDVVEARIRDRGPPILDRLDAIADEVATAVARYVEALPPRTLVFLFGDHGFAMDGDADSSEPARQGGASPEEVFVPASAWLVGGVH